MRMGGAGREMMGGYAATRCKKGCGGDGGGVRGGGENSEGDTREVGVDAC
eukprot:COSAG01_NODE_23511_length_812_cov_2.180926_2_plen_50_part_00